ncbi:MAG: nucleotidyltransferase domain-containing protein [Thermoplasmata archaeon]|nr:MAG: nucleotidyltransferase domain-containing protein [Thermoplasmata archaeon]
MRPNKQNILKYLKEIKMDLAKNGIFELGLFGSFSRDDENVYSDIDIAIKKEKNYLTKRTSYEYFEEINKIKSLVKQKFHRNIDIFDLDSNSSMKTTIMKDLIYV